MSAAEPFTARCPDWPELVARRDAGGPEPAGWDAAVVHLEACEGCRDAALAADPSLVFRRLRRVDAGAVDVESMRQAVASLRRASRVTAVETGSEAALEAPARSRGGRLRRTVGHHLRHLAAALLLAAAGFGAWLAIDDGPVQPAAVALRQAAAPAAGAAALRPLPMQPTAFGAPASADELASRPVVEGLSKPRAADVYQLGEEDLLVVMVVDETLDI
jgi:hypothetical protein